MGGVPTSLSGLFGGLGNLAALKGSTGLGVGGIGAGGDMGAAGGRHECPYCGQSVSTKQGLDQHVRLKHTHVGIKPWKCAYCDHASALKGNCQKHILRNHPGCEVRIEKIHHVE